MLFLTRIRGSCAARARSAGTILLELLAGFAATTARGTAGAKLENKGNQVEGGGDPHESHHARADPGVDVEVFAGGGEDVAEDDEHDGCNDGGNNGEESGHEG